MRNLLLFLWKHYFFFLFLLLEVMALYLVVNHNYYHRAQILNSTNQLTGTLFSTYSDITGYFQLKLANEQLAEENARLHGQLETVWPQRDSSLLQTTDSLARGRYQYVPAKVISNSVAHRNNYIMLDVGREDGVDIDMAVLGAQGIVGIVVEVSTHFCTAMSLLHTQSRISAKVKKNQQLGTVTWPGHRASQVVLQDLPTHIQILPGDTVVTSGFSHIFPEGQAIGRVADVQLESGNNFYTVRLDLSTDFNALHWVYVVNNLMKTEQVELENAVKDE